MRPYPHRETHRDLSDLFVVQARLIHNTQAVSPDEDSRNSHRQLFTKTSRALAPPSGQPTHTSSSLGLPSTPHFPAKQNQYLMKPLMRLTGHSETAQLSQCRRYAILSPTDQPNAIVVWR